MSKKRSLILWAIVLVTILVIAGCRATVRDVGSEENVKYSAEYGYTDLKVLSAEMATRILKTKLAAEEEAPVMIIYGIDNRTDEHIDTKALADSIRNELIKSGRFRFVNESQRKNIEKELNYQNQGYISPETKIQVGQQVGAKHMLTGSLVSISQKELKQVRIKKKELRYYRLTLEITDLTSNLIVWTDEQEIIREQAKPFIGW